VSGQHTVPGRGRGGAEPVKRGGVAFLGRRFVAHGEEPQGEARAGLGGVAEPVARGCLAGLAGLAGLWRGMESVPGGE
jgi:hypothetical protein